MILVTGATGTTGHHVVEQLTKKGEQVRALVRNPEKARQLENPNIEIAKGDFDDKESLEKALIGIKCAYLVTPTTTKRVSQEANFLETAGKARVKHIVRLSILGAEPHSPSQLLRRHSEADQQLKRSGIPYTLLKPSYFMQNLFWYADTIKKEGVFHASLPAKTRHSHIDARDIAVVAVAALTENGHENQVLRLTGPEALTYDEMMSILSDLLDKPLRYDPSPQNYAKSLEGWGLDIDEVLELDRVIAQGFGDGEAITNTVADVTGKEPYSFERFVKDYLSAFLV